MSLKETKPVKIPYPTRILSQIEERVPQIKNPSLQRWLMLLLLSIFIGSLLSPNLLKPTAKYKTGDVAERDIKASSSFSVEDYVPTEERRAEAAQAVLPVYDLDAGIHEQKIKRVTAAFSLMRQKTNFPEQRQKDFEKLLGVSSLPKDVFRSFERQRFPSAMEKGIQYLISETLGNGILPDEAPVPGSKVTIRKISLSHTEKDRITDQLFGLKQAAEHIEKLVDNLKGFSRRNRHVMAFLAQQMIQPNLTYNEQETERSRNQARREVAPVYLQVKKGEMIVREGERIQESHIVKLRAQDQASRHVNVLSTLIGSALLTALILKTLYDASLKRLKSFVSSNKNLLFLCTLLAFVLVAAKVTLFVIKAVSARMPYLDPDVLFYALPVASGSMLVSVFFASNVAIIFSVPTAILASLLLGESTEFFIYFLLGSIVASRNVFQYKDRGNIIRAGIVVGLAQGLLIIAFSLSSGSLLTIKAFEKIAVAFFGGGLLGMIVIGLIPIVEMVFGYTTNFKLLELASLDHPLMQELILQAPGTYHHSVIVGSMVESAARVIGANPLLTKVSAYYHDIGKIKKPAYFIENQRGQENKHEKLAPSMSSLILISHVKEGVELAKRYSLGPELIDIIRQHHGTSLISYFYEKAKGMQDAQSPPRIEDFRYPGPIPQTKEAGLVMLADVVEAASRSLNDPTPARLKGMVQKMINSIFADGQLNDCELTLKDMHQIAKSFTRILTGIFHQRIEYPESAAKGNGAKRTDANSDQQQTKSDKDRPSKDKEKSEETLKRLGSA